MRFNRKGQSIITIAIGLFIVGAVWLFGLAGWISATTSQFVALNNITGLEAFVYVNINLWLGIFYILAWIVLTRLG